LLATVAVLQYRWIKEIDIAMEDRAKTSLESSMTQWIREFYRGLYNICGSLQGPYDTAGRDEYSDFLQRYSNWISEQSAQRDNRHPNPAMVANVYIWQTSNRTNPKLLVLKVASNRIEEAEVPPHLQPLLTRLNERSQNLQEALRAWQLPGSSQSRTVAAAPPASSNEPQRPYFGWQVDQAIPAIVRPIARHVEPASAANRPESSEDTPVDWILVVLDLKTIQQGILPQLAKRNFNGPDGLDYKLAVVAPGATDRVVYTSDAGFPGQDYGVVDSTMNIFGPPENTDRRLGASLRNATPSEQSEESHLSGPGWLWFPVIQYGQGTAPWMLVVERRAGSIGTAASRQWRMNLLSSMTVLLLLAGGVGLVVVASLRMRRLAQMHMNFVSGVSHELHTPLAVMLSAAENLADGLVEKPPEVREHGRIIVGHGRQLSDLVDRILLFASSGAGGEFQLRQSVQVADMIDQVAQNLAETLSAARIHLELRIQPDLPEVLADPFVLRQCIQNLVVNAVKYRGASTWITIAAELAGAEAPSPEVRISVQDRGIGIREEELQRIFEAFYRSPDVQATNVQGTGLGLAVVKRSVIEMGGRVSVASTIGVGSTFTIHLPAAATQSGATPVGHSAGVSEPTS
jgi:signal transduction histidine kinase